MNFSGMNLNKISEDDQIWLEREISEIEVLSALKNWVRTEHQVRMGSK